MTGRYSYDDMNHKKNNSLSFKIDNELDLYIKVVSFLKKRYPNSIFIVTLGENQDTGKKRTVLVSHKKGYLYGSPDLIVQKELVFCHMISLRCCNGIKTMALRLSLVNYDYTVEHLIQYFKDVRIKCSYCQRKFISFCSIKNHIKGFHKLALIA